MSFNLLKFPSSFGIAVAGEVIRVKPLQMRRVESVCISLRNIDLGLQGVRGDENDMSHVVLPQSLPKGDAFLIVCKPWGVVKDKDAGIEIQNGWRAFPLPKDSDPKLLTHCAMA